MRRSNPSRFRAVVCALAVFSAAALPAAAQTDFPSVEPNQTKETATPAMDMVAGDTLLIGNCQQTSPNFFRVRVAPLPPAIYQHRLTLTANGVGYFDRIDIMGRDTYEDAAVPNSIARLATSEDSGAPLPFVGWYGFGKSEELYVNMVDSASCRTSSRVALSTVPVTPISIPPISLFNNLPSTVSIAATGIGSPVDVEVHVFDAEFNAIPGAWNDDSTSFFPAEARVFPKLQPGRYYVAVSETGIATHLPPTRRTTELKIPNEGLDFAGAVVAKGATPSFPIMVEIFGPGANNGTITMVTKDDPFEVVWIAFDLGMGQVGESFCPGDGTVLACPCGRAAPLGSGMGCVNSTGRGATVVQSYSGEQGSQRLTLEDLPPSAASIVFASLGTQAPAVTLGGVACLAQGAFRFPPIAADTAGTATHDFLLGTVPVALLGQSIFVQAGYRDSVAPPCNVNLTSGVRFLLQ